MQCDTATQLDVGVLWDLDTHDLIAFYVRGHVDFDVFADLITPELNASASELRTIVNTVGLRNMIRHGYMRSVPSHENGWREVFFVRNGGRGATPVTYIDVDNTMEVKTDDSGDAQLP